MAVPVRVREEFETTGDLGERRAMHLHKPCRYAACVERGITALGDEDLCCDHFVLRCYEFLEQIDAERTRNNNDQFVSPALKSSVNSCLQGALEVSLQSDSLSNLQKARLLDIMLWAGEFVHRADAAMFGSGNTSKYRSSATQTQQRATYVAPKVKVRTGLLPQ